MSKQGASKKGSPIVLADVQHLGKRADAPGADDLELQEVLKPRYAATGPAMRRGFRRNMRRLTALDAQVGRMTKKPKYSSGKNVKRLNARIQKYIRQSRLLTGLLIRATGAAAPSLIAYKDFVMPAYKQRIAEYGTTISKPNLIARDQDVI
jgi:hypothetical protein